MLLFLIFVFYLFSGEITGNNEVSLNKPDTLLQLLEKIPTDQSVKSLITGKRTTLFQKCENHYIKGGHNRGSTGETNSFRMAIKPKDNHTLNDIQDEKAEFNEVLSYFKKNKKPLLNCCSRKSRENTSKCLIRTYGIHVKRFKDQKGLTTSTEELQSLTNAPGLPNPKDVSTKSRSNKKESLFNKVKKAIFGKTKDF